MIVTNYKTEGAMNDITAIREKVIEIAEANGWAASIIVDNGDDCTYEFSKFSPAGQDFCFDADMENNKVFSLISNIFAAYQDYDCSEETYIWLDDTGHGKNGAPYDMKDVYGDMDACKQMMMDLYHALLSAENWSQYYE